jgi:galactitol-specific phosphotransferase system IIC component
VDQIIGFANAVFTPIINMGAAPMMVIILTVIACCFKVKFSEPSWAASSWASPSRASVPSSAF